MKVSAKYIEVLVSGLANAREHSAGLANELVEAENHLHLERAKVRVEVANELDDTGKPIYKNADMREHAVAERLQDDEAYQSVVRLATSKQNSRILRDCEAESYKSIIRLLASGIEWEGGDEDIEAAINSIRTMAAKEVAK